MRLGIIILFLSLFLNGFSKPVESSFLDNGLEFLWLPTEATNDEFPWSTKLPENEQPYEQSESPNDSDGIVHQLLSPQLPFINSTYPLQAHSLSAVYWEISTPPPKL